jgi:general secretion pathway protein G
VSGIRISDFGFRISDYKSRSRGFLSPIPQSTIRNPQSKGFTLLELMIVISIIVILAVIAMPQYQKTILHARETVLRDNLYHLRKAIDLYGADKGKLPQDLSELVTAGYVREVPIDPMTGANDWTLERGDDPSSLTGESGITNVRSASSENSTEGTPYSEW